MQFANPAASRRGQNLAVLCGLLGTAALVAYYAAPYTFLPLRPPNATADQVMAFSTWNIAAAITLLVRRPAYTLA